VGTASVDATGVRRAAFGIPTRFVHEADYGELETGQTSLAFAGHHMGADNLPAGYVAADTAHSPLGIEVALVTEQVAEAHARAVNAGATSIKEPSVKPWGRPTLPWRETMFHHSWRKMG